MNIIVAVQEAFNGDASPGLASALSVAGPTDRVVAVLHRPASRWNDDEIDNEIEDLSAYLARQEPGFRIKTTTSDDNVADVLVDLAEHEHAELIVVEIAHQPTGRGSVLGKQAQRLILEAPCSVLVARPVKEN